MKNVKLIRKYYKKINAEILSEVIFDEYNYFNIYIAVLYYEDIDKYKINWIDFNLIENGKYIDSINSQIINKSLAKEMHDIITKKRVIRNYEEKYHNEKQNFIINIYDDKNKCEYKLVDYLPLKLSFLTQYIEIMFSHLPLMLLDFKNKTLSYFNGKNWFYKMGEEIDINIFKEDINFLFSRMVIEEKEKLRKKDINFFEKVGNKYIGLFEKKIITTIDYNEEHEKLNMACNCDKKELCEHKLLALELILKKYEKRFYKITYQKGDETLYEKMLSYNFVLCIGITDYSFVIINELGLIDYINILDRKWKVLEDDKKRSLSKTLNQVYLSDNF